MNNALKWRLLLALVAVFFAGVAVGVVGAAQHARHAFFARHSMHFDDRMREQLRRELNLTAEQSEKIGPLVDEMSKRLEVIREDTSKRVAATMGESHNQIVPLLTAEQREKLEQMKLRHEQMLHRHGMRGMHSPMPEGH